MIVVMRNGATQPQIKAVVDRILELGFRPHLSQGEERTIIGVIGDERPVNESVFRIMDGVEKVVRVLKPYKLASRDFHPLDTIVPINGISIGDKAVVVMAGAFSNRAPRPTVFRAWEKRPSTCWQRCGKRWAWPSSPR